LFPSSFDILVFFVFQQLPHLLKQHAQVNLFLASIDVPVSFVFPFFSWLPLPNNVSHQVVVSVFSWQSHQVACSLTQLDTASSFVFLLVPLCTPSSSI